MKQAGARLRAEAATVVHAVVSLGRSLDAAEQTAEVSEQDRSRFRAIVFGTLRHWWQLTRKVDACLQRPLRKRDEIVRALLAVGVFQLEAMRVSPHAAVQLTVEATRLMNRPKLAGLVNAVLRRCQREPDVSGGDSEESRFNHPQWMIDRIRGDWPDHWQAVLDANNRQAPMWLRVNARQGSTDDYLRATGIEAETRAGIDSALRLEKPCIATELPGFADGRVSVQDAAAQLAAPWLLADGGHRLLDLCAAPGGKSAQLLECAGPEARLVAVDIDPGRAERVRETLERLGLATGATIHAADASVLEDWWNGEPFDRVLLDAPCSASGVIRRHPDIKHLRRPGDLEALAVLQGRLLEAGWRVLQPGGRLLYVTCSVFRSENDDVIERFLRSNPNAARNNVLPNNNIHDLIIRTAQGFQVLPGTGGLDGFYYACLDKSG